MDSTRSFARLTARALGLLAACCSLAAGAFNHDRTVAPIAAGRFNVSCSNIAQDTSRIASGGSASDYWEGRQVNGVDHYVNELLAAPQTAVQFDAAVPNNTELFTAHAGGKVTFVAIVCYPTPASNSDPNYTLPQTGGVVPHMQPAGTVPKIISLSEYCTTLGLVCVALAGPAKLPVIVFSHGLGGSPIGSGYIDALVQLASQGFMVAAVFHGDSRFSRVRIEDLSDVIYLLRDFDRVVEMMTMRPLSLKVMTDVLLANPGYSAAFDTTRIGGFGASLGGEAMALLLGSKLTTTIGGHCTDPGLADPRIRAVVGYVPYAGQTFAPAFCEGNKGAASVNRPYLALSGTADTTAPIGMMKAAVGYFQSSRYLVQLIDGQHELRPQDAGLLFTWTVTFLNAYLDVQADPTAMARLIRMNTVSGGGRDNNVIFDVHIPFAPAAGETLVRELYDPIINHYTMSPDGAEADALKAGVFGPGWDYTGMAFKGWSIFTAAVTQASPICRFRLAYQNPSASTFYTASGAECDSVLLNRGWRYVGIAYYAVPATSNACPDGYLGVHRAYNNGFVHNDSNHRYTTSDSTMRDMQSAGWKFEATTLCSRP